MKLYRLSFLFLLVPSLAAAHVGINGPLFSSKTGQKVTFSINHGCTSGSVHLDTLSVQVDIPEGIDAASVRALPSQLDATPAVTKTGTAVTSVKWTRDPATLQNDDVAVYEVTLRLSVGNVPFTRIPFTVTQVCRLPGGDPADDITVVWTGPSEPTPAPRLTVVPAHALGWHKITLTAAVAFADFKYYFADTQIVWKGTSAFSPNAVVDTLIGMTPGVTALSTDLAAGDEIWVKY